MLRDAKYGEVYLENAPKSAIDPAVEEPVFVLRAQDDSALHLLVRYKNYHLQIEDPAKRPSQEWFDGLDGVIEAFGNFRANNEDRVKIAD